MKATLLLTQSTTVDRDKQTYTARRHHLHATGRGEKAMISHHAAQILKLSAVSVQPHRLQLHVAVALVLHR